MLPTVETTARFGQDEVLVTVATSQYGEGARTVAFAAPLRLSEEELWAALWYGAQGEDAAELEDLGYVREIVAGVIINHGLETLDEARAELAELAERVPGSEWHAWALEVRDIARRAFAPVLPAVSGSRQLAGVA